MNLRKYLYINDLSLIEISEKGGIDPCHLSLVISGKRSLTNKLAKKIEAATEGKLTVELIFKLWQEHKQ